MKKSTSSILLTFFSLFLIFFYSNSFPRPFDDPKNLIFYLACGSLFLFHNLEKKSESNLSNSLPFFFQVCLGIYFSFCLLSLFSKPQPLGESLLEISRLILWIALIWVLSQKNYSSLIKLLQGMACSVWIIVLVNFLAAKGMISFGEYPQMIVWPLGHMTYASDFMALMAWVALFGVLREREGGGKKEVGLRIFWMLTFFLALWGLWSTGTRASILGFLSAIVLGAFILFWQKIISLKKIFLFLSGLVLLLIGVNTLSSSKIRGEATENRLGSLQQIFHSDKLQDISSGRWHIYKNTLQMIKDKPWQGWGLGTFRFAYYGYRNSAAIDPQANASFFIMHPHNEILHQLVSVGVLGGLVWLSFFLGIYFFGFRILSSLERGEKIILLFALGALTISLVSWQLSTNYLFPLSRWITGIFLAMIFNVFKLRTSPLDLPFQNKVKKLAGLFLLASFILVCSHQISLYFLQKSNTQIDVQDRKIDLVLAQKLGMGSFQTETALAIQEFNFGDSTLGMQKIERLAEVYPNVPNILFYKAVVKLKQNQISEAQSILEQTLAIDSQYQPAQRLLEQVKNNNL